jgi:hypothetical protein
MLYAAGPSGSAWFGGDEKVAGGAHQTLQAEALSLWQATLARVIALPTTRTPPLSLFVFIAPGLGDYLLSLIVTRSMRLALPTRSWKRGRAS